MAWAVPFARSVVIHFQHDYFLYWIVSPKWCRIDDDEGTFLLVYKMYHQCDTKLFTSMVHYCSLLKCITKEKNLAKLWNFVSSWNCSCEPKTIGTCTASLFTIMYHQCDTIPFMSKVICHSSLKRITENNEMARNSKVFTKKPVFGQGDRYQE